MAATPRPTQIAGQIVPRLAPVPLWVASQQRDAGNDRAGGIAEDGRLQAAFLAAVMVEARPSDERSPDRERTAERAKEKPGGDCAKHAKTDCKCGVRGHLGPLSMKERADAPNTPAVHRLDE